MKRLIAITALLVSVLAAPPALADDDIAEQLKQYSVQQLYTVYTAIEKELVSRGGSENMQPLSGGRYVAGTQLPAGTYVLILQKGLFGIGEARVYASMDDYRSGDALDRIEVMGTGSRATVTLEEGNVLYIDSSCTFFIKKGQDKVFDF